MLCLHGYHGSAAILRGQMAPPAAALPSNVELVYVDAPSLAIMAGGFTSTMPQHAERFIIPSGTAATEPIVTFLARFSHQDEGARAPVGPRSGR